jgi:hypothetical protein
MNKWKIAFWICLTLLVSVTAISLYSLIGQGVTLGYMREGYIETENDLEVLSTIINQTDFSKEQIKQELTHHRLFEYMNFNNDTVSLDRINLIFNNDKLIKVTNQW